MKPERLEMGGDMKAFHVVIVIIGILMMAGLTVLAVASGQ